MFRFSLVSHRRRLMSSFATAAVSGLRCADELESLKAIYVDELRYLNRTSYIM